MTQYILIGLFVIGNYSRAKRMMERCLALTVAQYVTDKVLSLYLVSNFIIDACEVSADVCWFMICFCRACFYRCTLWLISLLMLHHSFCYSLIFVSMFKLQHKICWHSLFNPSQKHMHNYIQNIFWMFTAGCISLSINLAPAELGIHGNLKKYWPINVTNTHFSEIELFMRMCVVKLNLINKSKFLCSDFRIC